MLILLIIYLILGLIWTTASMDAILEVGREPLVIIFLFLFVWAVWPVELGAYLRRYI